MYIDFYGIHVWGGDPGSQDSIVSVLLSANLESLVSLVCEIFKSLNYCGKTSGHQGRPLMTQLLPWDCLRAPLGFSWGTHSSKKPHVCLGKSLGSLQVLTNS